MIAIILVLCSCILIGIFKLMDGLIVLMEYIDTNIDHIVEMDKIGKEGITNHLKHIEKLIKIYGDNK